MGCRHRGCAAKDALHPGALETAAALFGELKSTGKKPVSLFVLAALAPDLGEVHQGLRLGRVQAMGTCGLGHLGPIRPRSVELAVPPALVADELENAEQIPPVAGGREQTTRALQLCDGLLGIG